MSLFLNLHGTFLLTILHRNVAVNAEGQKQIGLTIPPNVLARADRVNQMTENSRQRSGVSKSEG
jgi:hypothetical protein